jgi:hypothetical protein
MVRDSQVAELVDDHVVDHLERGQHETPVERERSTRRARAPERPLGSDPDCPVGDADSPRLCRGEVCDQSARPTPPSRFGQREVGQPQARHLASALLLDPRPSVRKYVLDLSPGHALWNDEPDRLAPASLQSPPPCPGRAADLDPVHWIETSGRSGREAARRQGSSCPVRRGAVRSPRNTATAASELRTPSRDLAARPVEPTAAGSSAARRAWRSWRPGRCR